MVCQSFLVLPGVSVHHPDFYLHLYVTLSLPESVSDFLFLGGHQSHCIRHHPNHLILSNDICEDPIST